MNTDDIDLLIGEFSKNEGRWTDLALQRIVQNAEIKIRIKDRYFHLVLSLTSICAAFLTIVTPLLLGLISRQLILVIVFFLITFCLGIIFLFMIIMRDKKLAKENGDWEEKNLKEYQQMSIDITTKLRQFRVKQDQDLLTNIEKMIQGYYDKKDELSTSAEKIEHQRKQQFSYRFISFLQILFWYFLVLSIVSMGIWLWLQF